MLGDLSRVAPNSKKQCLALNLSVTPQTQVPMTAKHNGHCVRIITDSPWTVRRQQSNADPLPSPKQRKQRNLEGEGGGAGWFHLKSVYLTPSFSQTFFLQAPTGWGLYVFSSVSRTLEVSSLKWKMLQRSIWVGLRLLEEGETSWMAISLCQ